MSVTNMIFTIRKVLEMAVLTVTPYSHSEKSYNYSVMTVMIQENPARPSISDQQSCALCSYAVL